MEKSTKDTFLYRENGIAFHILTPAFRDEALVVIARSFCTEPITTSLADVFPEKKVPFMEFLHFTEYWMDHASTNGMSVVAIDEKDHRVAGALILVDLLFEPEGFVERYTDEKNNLTPIMALVK